MPRRLSELTNTDLEAAAFRWPSKEAALLEHLPGAFSTACSKRRTSRLMPSAAQAPVR